MAKTKKNPRILEECEDFLWSEWRDLNPRPLGPELCANRPPRVIVSENRGIAPFF